MIKDPTFKSKHLVEFKVLYPVLNVCHTTITQKAWAKKKKLSIHGWVYDMSTGPLKDLDCCISWLDQVEDTYHSLEIF